MAKGSAVREPKPTRPDLNGASDITPSDDESLVELLDRLLHAGVVLCGDVTISVADVELVFLRLQLVLSSIETAREVGWYRPGQPAAQAPIATSRSSQATDKGECA